MEDFLAVNSRGIYSVGKFDEIRSRAKPYSAIVDALSRLIGKIANSDELEDVKINMKEVFGSEAKVLCELVPAISQLTGETASGETKNLGVGKGYAFTRFRDLIRSFMRVISSHDRPILLFLDDLQWADKASCALMESLASDPDSENILFVWAYRDSENGKEAPSLVASVAEKSSLRLLDIPISAIDSQSLTEMISYLAQLSQEEVKPLSDLLSRRTGGNIHFVIQFLHMLQHQGLLVFSEELQQWDWDIELIETETVVTDNVADILTAKIARQPGDVQSVLQLAACLGFFFDIKLLETISRAEGILSEDPESFAASCFDELEESSPELWRGPFRRFMRIAQGESLIIQTRDPRVFRFSHDRVRQCAYEMIRDAEKRERLHLRVGMFIWTQIKMKASDDLLLLLAVDQLNRGSRHIQDEDTRTKLAKLNLDSAKRAGLKSAYTLAADLLNKGIRLLNPRTKWLKNTYDLCLELYTSSAEMECSLGNFENCDERVEAILARAHSIDEKLRAYYVLLDTLGIRRRLDEGINTGTEVLSLIGERLPRRPGMMKVLVELAKTKRAIKGRKSRDLSSLPMIKEARPIATMRILGSIALFAWHSHNNNLLTFVFLRMTRVTLTQGLCKYSPFAFAAFGMLLGALGDTMQAHEFGTLALQLLSKAKTKDCTCSTQLIVGIFVEHLKKPLSSVAPDLMEAYRVGMENGDVQYACLSLSAFGGLSAVMGKPLRSLIADLHRHRRIYQEYNQDHADVLIAPWLQFALNMTGQADNLTVLTGEAMNEANFMSEAVTLAKVNVHFIRMILLYILGQVEAASVELEALERCQGSTEGTHFMTTFIIMYSGLVSLAMAQKTQRRKYIAGSRKYMNLISKYVKDGRMNCPPLFCLLQAIQKSGTSDKSRKAEVHQAFDDAISANARGGFLQFEAIANEMAGEFMLSCQDLSLGHSYLHRAWQLYSEWQADAKVQQLETKYRAMQITTAVNSSTRVDNSPGRGD
jgi:predicted ATPase